MGKFGQVRLQRGAVKLLNGGRDAQVQPTPPRGRDVLVQHLANEVVGKTPTAHDAGHRFQQPRSGRLIEQVVQVR
jgi:hypothetical protein